MKATELRVNNLVHFSLSNIVRVESINTHTCICKAKYSRSGKDIFEDMISFSGDTASGNAPIESFWGIPLTEEILLKCRFKKKNGYKFVLHNSHFSLVMIDSINREDYAFSHYNLWVNLEHVHQLQNLYFALTGQELEVNL